GMIGMTKSIARGYAAEGKKMPGWLSAGLKSQTEPRPWRRESINVAGRSGAPWHDHACVARTSGRMTTGSA
ncbi:MAG: hypothetical protein KY476_12955, partial [Planctomycetes bacterium]|nr:hypothetical protein [Planctomycetota bacterium]